MLIGPMLMGVLVGVAGAAATSSTDPSAAPIDRTITDSRITESSGLAPSLLHPGVLWTHNDSGNPPLIYAIGPDGTTRATLRLGQEPNVDWEAITTLRAPPGTTAPGEALIAIGDIGDNTGTHPSVRIAIVPEPRRLWTASLSPVRVLRLRYPGGPRDAEALLADPDSGRLYVVSKTLLGSELYVVPGKIWPGDRGQGLSGTSPLTTLTWVATMTAGLVTDGAFLPDGRMLLRGYDQVYLVDRPSAARGGRLSTLASALLPSQDQGESIAVIDHGRQALIGSEGRREPVLRIPLPALGHQTFESKASSPGSTKTPVPAGAATSPTVSGLAVGTGDARIWAAAAGVGLALTALIGVGLMFWTRPS